MKNNINNTNKIYKVDYSRTFLNEEVYNRYNEESEQSRFNKTIVISFLIFCVVIIGALINTAIANA